MLIYPAIDLYAGEAVRLFKGDYAKKTVYSSDPVKIAIDFRECGAEYMHIVDLEGAKTGETPNFDLITRIKKEGGLFCEVGGGIRSIGTVEKYINAGIDRVILGTAAVTDESFLLEAVRNFKEKIAVGIDIKNENVAIKGWLEDSKVNAFDFCRKIESIGVSTLICTDISRDGAMQGTNRELYRTLSENYNISIIASGGVSSLDDVKALRRLDIYGAIIGKAYYTGSIDLKEAIEVAK